LVFADPTTRETIERKVTLLAMKFEGVSSVILLGWDLIVSLGITFSPRYALLKGGDVRLPLLTEEEAEDRQARASLSSALNERVINAVISEDISNELSPEQIFGYGRSSNPKS
jgi:hypothetical protein